MKPSAELSGNSILRKGDIVAIMLKAPWQNHRIPMNSVDHAAAFPGPTPHICDRGNTTRSLQNMPGARACAG